MGELKQSHGLRPPREAVFPEQDGAAFAIHEMPSNDLAVSGQPHSLTWNQRRLVKPRQVKTRVALGSSDAFVEVQPQHSHVVRSTDQSDVAGLAASLSF